MPWFINETEVERRGAVQLLHPCRDFSPVQIALQQLRSGISPETAGQALASFFKQQVERIEQLERELQFCQSEKSSWKDQLESYWADPLHKRLGQIRREFEEQRQRTERAEKNESELHVTLERQHKLYEEQVHVLKQQVLELNRLVAKQHKRLAELTGSDTPE